jgi:hypothetical protein
MFLNFCSLSPAVHLYRAQTIMVETPMLKIPFAIKKRNINEKLILQLFPHYYHNPTTHHRMNIQKFNYAKNQKNKRQ